MSALLHNAIDSLEFGMHLYLDGRDSASSRKHAILTIFHSIELILKEYLWRINPVLIYKSIDKKITASSQTVGFAEILVRLENVGLDIHASERKVIEAIQQRRNRIEHHSYEEDEGDILVLSESLKFLIFFTEEILNISLETELSKETLIAVRRLVFDYLEREGMASYRLNKWLNRTYTNWDEQKEDTPDEFPGTHQCPECRQDFLVFHINDKPFCFFCNSGVEAYNCEYCGETHFTNHKCKYINDDE